MRVDTTRGRVSITRNADTLEQMLRQAKKGEEEKKRRREGRGCEMAVLDWKWYSRCVGWAGGGRDGGERRVAGE